jgi:hypothetical protein
MVFIKKLNYTDVVGAGATTLAVGFIGTDAATTVAGADTSTGAVTTKAFVAPAVGATPDCT